MNQPTNLVHMYRLDLIELLAALVFLVVFKIVLVWGMAKLSVVLQDDDDHKDRQPSKPAKLSQSLNRFRWILGLLLIVNGLVQVRPILIGQSSAKLLEQYTGFLSHDGMATGFAHFWAGHTVWMNIWSVVLQLALGAAILMFHGRLVVRIVSGLIGFFALLSWVFAQNFGDFGSASPGFFAGAPTASLLILLFSLLCFFPDGDWKNGKMSRRLTMVSTAFWLGLTLMQWLPEDGYWSASGYQSLQLVLGHSLLGGFRNGLVHAFATAPVLWTIVIGVASALIGAFTWFVTLHKTRLMWVWLVLTVCASFIVWVVSQADGPGTLYVFPLGTGLVVVAFSALQWLSQKAVASVA